MDITVNRRICPNFTALQMKCSRKERKAFGPYDSTGFKRIENVLKPLGEVADIEIKPIIEDKCCVKGMQITVDSLDKNELDHPYVMRIRGATFLYDETIINAQRMVKELIQKDTSGALYAPRVGLFPRTLNEATPQLKELAKNSGCNIYIFPHCCGHGDENHGYYVLVDKPEFEPRLVTNSDFRVYEDPDRFKEIYKVPYEKFKYVHPYSCAVDMWNANHYYKTLPEILVGAAKFYTDNMKQGKEYEIYKYSVGN